MCSPSDKSSFFFSFFLSFSFPFFLPLPARLSTSIRRPVPLVRYRCRAILPALRKSRGNRSRTPPESAIQYRNLFQFHGSPFAHNPLVAPTPPRPVALCRSLSGTALRPLIREFPTLSLAISVPPPVHFPRPIPSRPFPCVVSAPVCACFPNLSCQPFVSSITDFFRARTRVLVAQVRLIL